MHLRRVPTTVAALILVLATAACGDDETDLLPASHWPAGWWR